MKTDERFCPFCKGVLGESNASDTAPATTSRLSRAAALAFSASLAVTGVAAGSSGCSTGTVPAPGDAAAADGSPGPRDDGGLQAAYGAPAVDDGGPDDDGSAIAEYGASPVDSGK